MVPDKDSQLASCTDCGFAFCSNCRYTFHGVSPCRMFRNDKDRREIVSRYQAAGDEEKIAIEKLYGKNQLEKAVNEFLSQQWIDEWSKPCPNCKACIEVRSYCLKRSLNLLIVYIQKIEGCHKMTCWRCNSYFCWLCLHLLNVANPYTHFNDPRSPCYKQLFQGIDENDVNLF